jgi:hypothetical protein
MKIAICTPVHSTVQMEFAYSLALMVQYTARAEIIVADRPSPADCRPFMAQSSVLPWGRNLLVDMALDFGADYLLWIDSDMSFPLDGLTQLLSLDLPVVGANYLRRGPVVRPTAIGLEKQDVWTTKELADAEHVEEVSGLGLGFCLVNMQVIHKLREEPVPYFALTMIQDGKEIRGEDYYFFDRVRKAGIPVYLDHALSWHVLHHTHRGLSFQDVA